MTIRAIDGIYLAMLAWHPDRSPTFADGAVADAFGLSADGGASQPVGPFQRPRTRDLALTLAVTRQDGFPGDGLARIRDGVNAIVAGYGIGSQVWANDFVAAVEAIPGTRLTASTVQYDSADVSGVDVPLDIVWALAPGDLAITIT